MITVTFTCAFCSKEIQIPPYDVKRRKYCSRKCSSLAQKISVSVQCPTCGKAFKVQPYRLRNSDTVYCSVKCAKYQVSMTCDWCNKTFQKPPSAIKDHNFCCRKCCRAWQGANGIVGYKYAQVEVTCATCGKVFSRQKNAVERSKNQYCGKECFYKAHQDNMAGELNPAWRGGFDPYYGPNWKRQSRRARNRDNHTCQRCGITEADLERKLHVHHKIPLREFDRNFRKANALANLVSLCPSCHIALEWQRGQRGHLHQQPAATSQTEPALSLHTPR